VTKPVTRAVFGAFGVMMASACGGGAVITPSPVPAAPTVPRVVERGPLRVALPLRIPGATWRVQSVARVKVAGDGVTGAAGDEQRVESRGVVSWSFDRTAAGALKGSGQVDSFTVRTSFDNSKGTMLPSMPALLLLDALMDSALVRVTTRPPLANECDRPEAGATALARELLVRIPNGILAGERWKDSTVTLVCRSGVPMTVYTTVISTLEKLDDRQVVVRRELATRLEGKGGSPFRSLELAGTATGSQRVEIGAAEGTVERLEGTSTLTMQATERTPGNAPRSQQIVQKAEVKAERVR
jgi:hypothetical protein